jgi:hypothetical protein
LNVFYGALPHTLPTLFEKRVGSQKLLTRFDKKEIYNLTVLLFQLLPHAGRHRQDPARTAEKVTFLTTANAYHYANTQR